QPQIRAAGHQPARRAYQRLDRPLRRAAFHSHGSAPVVYWAEKVGTPLRMPKPLVVLNAVGLTHEMLGPDTPCISAIAKQGFGRPMGAVLPAVTCSAQATLLTGTLPREHGIVANGWYFRDLAEVLFWRQSNHLVQGEKLYEAGRRRDPSYTTAKLF